MSTTLRLTLLGTGSSTGVPRVGNDWGACDPSEPKNNRRRCCALIDQISGDGNMTRVLIDTSPDLRQQLLDANVSYLDAIMYTHDHADQAHGIDDVRILALRSGRRIPTHMDAATRETLSNRFAYCFEGAGGYPAILDLQPPLKSYQSLSIQGEGGALEILPVELEHGRIKCMGYRIGGLAYCNDVHAIPQESMDRLRDLDVLVVDALRYAAHPSHANVATALSWIEELKPKRAVLTNMHVDLDYATLSAQLPDGVEAGYDGMELEIAATGE